MDTTKCCHHLLIMDELDSGISYVGAFGSINWGANGFNKTHGTVKMTVILLRHELYVVLFIHGLCTCLI